MRFEYNHMMRNIVLWGIDKNFKVLLIDKFHIIESRTRCVSLYPIYSGIVLVTGLRQLPAKTSDLNITDTLTTPTFILINPWIVSCHTFQHSAPIQIAIFSVLQSLWNFSWTINLGHFSKQRHKNILWQAINIKETVFSRTLSVRELRH